MKPWIDGVAIDKEIAEESPCEECGAAMKYEPRYERSQYQNGELDHEETIYRAFAVCTNDQCDNEIEF